MTQENSFIADVNHLRKYIDTIVLDRGDSKIAVVPAYQGRTMTSTARGDDGTSCGWINLQQIASGFHNPQVNLFGGEDRYWISPEGGQFSFFFKPGSSFEFAHWRTPKVVDSLPFDLVEHGEHFVKFQKEGKIRNFSGSEFEIGFERTVNLLARDHAERQHDLQLANLDVVFHESQNKLTNIGKRTWQPETGLISIWILCMNKPAPNATLIVPYQKGDSDLLGPIVTADYFGKLGDDRLKISESHGLIYMRGDGELRSKLGLGHSRVKSVLGSWDPSRKLLSIVDFNLPDSAPHGYTNNLWELQEDPYAGDVVNGYNDGPTETGERLGGFFELETLSPALGLVPGESYTHIHRTLRILGERADLTHITHQVFGVGLEEIEKVFSAAPRDA